MTRTIAHTSQRDPAYDVLRSAVILIALVLHFGTKHNLSSTELPFRFFQEFVFSVGGLFFFVSGTMAARITLPRFRSAPGPCARKLVKKGLLLFVVYYSYVLFMFLSHADAPEMSLYTLSLAHPYFVVVLLTFGILFTIQPLILWAVSKKEINLLLIIMACVVLHIALLGWADLPHWARMLLVDKASMRYPVIPSLLIFLCAFAWDRAASARRKTPSPGLKALSAMVFLGAYVAVLAAAYGYDRQAFEAFQPLAGGALFTVARESVMIVAALWLVRGALPRLPILAAPGWTVFGRHSLRTYVGGNILLNLVSPPHSLALKWLLLLAMAAVLRLALPERDPAPSSG